MVSRPGQPRRRIPPGKSPSYQNGYETGGEFLRGKPLTGHLAKILLRYVFSHGYRAEKVKH